MLKFLVEGIRKLSLKSKEAQSSISSAAFVPIDCNRWTFELDGFDPWLFARVKLPTLGTAVRSVTVWLHNPVASKVNAQLAQWLAEGKPRRGCFKLLDAVGETVETWTFDELKPNYVVVGVDGGESWHGDPKPFDYDRSGFPMISRLIMSCSTPTVS
jgi:hypothetical protein